MQTTTFTFHITEAALAELRNIMQEEQVGDGKALRIGVKGGGCSGMSYILEFEEQTPFDEVFDWGGIKVLVDKRHQLYLEGLELDYQYGLNNRGFIFNNPNAKSTCGCGTSFSA